MSIQRILFRNIRKCLEKDVISILDFKVDKCVCYFFFANVRVISLFLGVLMYCFILFCSVYLLPEVSYFDVKYLKIES